jgi:hypothetical protein
MKKLLENQELKKNQKIIADALLPAANKLLSDKLGATITELEYRDHSPQGEPGWYVISGKESMLAFIGVSGQLYLYNDATDSYMKEAYK